MTQPERKSRIPEFRTREEEAKFWDTHDFTEFEDELQRVNVEVARPLSHVLQVRLDDDAMHRIARSARAKGLAPSTLARMWILEHLSESSA